MMYITMHFSWGFKAWRAGCDSIIFVTSDTIEMRVWREKLDQQGPT